tara:strand:+ start:193 stop:612 length:420 start_codon:yes stop_codon:yes gene_type:complete
MMIENYDKFLNILPNIFSISIVAPILLYVSIFPKKNKILYIILFLIGLILSLSISYNIIYKKKKLTIGRLIYLSIFIPILMYISIKKENSHIYSRYLLFYIASIYFLYNFNIVFFDNNILFNSLNQLGFPIHPLKQLTE